ncbi:MAG: iron ABC transporter permease [Candidatus Methanoplasma sp.]|jgi:iron complex transport system permease protein|nr:iron ABC transporter permease [Candidatus Methanoplasma sp.]
MTGSRHSGNLTEQQEKNEEYKRKRELRNLTIIVICAVVLAAVVFVCANIGYIKFSIPDIFRIFTGGGTNRENLVVFEFRMPRIIVSILAGAALALSGCILQGVVRNDLADPGLLGINAGAGLLVILYVMFFGTQSFLSVFTLPFLALIGAGVATAAVYALAFKRGEGVAPMRLILTGVAIQAGIAALTTVLVVKLDDDQFDFVARWQAGSIWGSSWDYVIALLPWLLILVPYVMSKFRVLDVLNLGDSVAGSLGASVEKERRGLLAAAAGLAASAVAIGGNISFVGLIAPHLGRRLVGPRHLVLLPTCALLGAVLVSVADTIARVIVEPSEIPTGIVVAIVGAPYFLYLLMRNKH